MHKSHYRTRSPILSFLSFPTSPPVNRCDATAPSPAPAASALPTLVVLRGQSSKPNPTACSTSSSTAPNLNRYACTPKRRDQALTASLCLSLSFPPSSLLCNSAISSSLPGQRALPSIHSGTFTQPITPPQFSSLSPVFLLPFFSASCSLVFFSFPHFINLFANSFEACD